MNTEKGKEITAMQTLIDKYKALPKSPNGWTNKLIEAVINDATSLLAKEADDKKNEAISFALHLEKMNPINKFSVHPPAGSGGSTGIYEKTVEQLYTHYSQL